MDLLCTSAVVAPPRAVIGPLLDIASRCECSAPTTNNGRQVMDGAQISHQFSADDDRPIVLFF